MPDRIVVTGMGTVNPLGNTVAETWRNALEGVSGVGPITRLSPDDYLIQFAAEVKNFKPEDYMAPKEVRRLDRYEHFAIAAAAEALQQSGLEINEENAPRIGTVISTAIGGLESIQDGILTMLQQGGRRVSPLVVTMMMPNGAAGMISILHGAQGPSFSVSTACASGTDAIGNAWMLLRTGVVDAMIAGASDCVICDIGLVAFDRLGALSRREDFSMTPQPFDKNRDGLVMAEGGAVLIMETESHARERGAEILGVVAGHSSTADAYHITAPLESGSGAARAMRYAMSAAGINPEDVDYINAHGTGTELNDEMETRAIKTVLGPRAYETPVSSTKSMTGHMMGATGALEAIFCLLSIRDGVVPPTIHLENPDPLCDLDYVPHEARQHKVKVAVSNSFGFGGHNGVLVLTSYNGA